MGDQVLCAEIIRLYISLSHPVPKGVLHAFDSLATSLKRVPSPDETAPVFIGELSQEDESSVPVISLERVQSRQKMLSNGDLEDIIIDFLPRADRQGTYFVYSTENAKNYISGEIQEKMTNTTQPLFYIFIVKNTHWVLLVYNPSEKIFALFDSINHDTQISEEKRKEIKNDLKIEIAAEFIPLCESLTQRGDWQCGYYVLEVFKTLFCFQRKPHKLSFADMIKQVCDSINREEFETRVNDQCKVVLKKKKEEEKNRVKK